MTEKNISQPEEKKTSNKGRVEAQIEVPGLKIVIETKDSVGALREIRKIVEAVRATDMREEEFDEANFDGSRGQLWSLSEEAQTNDKFMEFIKLASKAEEKTTYKRITLPNKKIVDVNQKKVYAILNLENVKTVINSALYNINRRAIKFAAVHVMSDVNNEEKQMLCDLIAENLGSVEVRREFTHKDVLGKTVAEVVIFGDTE